MLFKHSRAIALVTTSVLFAALSINGCSDSTSADAKHAEYRVPNSDVRLTITIQPETKQRTLRATDDEQELFATKLDKTEANTTARLYKGKEDYTLVDSNGDRYLLNMREKHFTKSAPSKNATSATYVGKFDFDKKQHWRFIPSKQVAQVSDAPAATAASSASSDKRQFGPPSKQFR